MCEIFAESTRNCDPRRKLDDVHLHQTSERTVYFIIWSVALQINVYEVDS